MDTFVRKFFRRLLFLILWRKEMKFSFTKKLSRVFLVQWKLYLRLDLDNHLIEVY